MWVDRDAFPLEALRESLSLPFEVSEGTFFSLAQPAFSKTRGSPSQTLYSHLTFFLIFILPLKGPCDYTGPI